MKNLYYQSARKAAKHFHRRQRGDHFEKGIKLQHDYSNDKATKLSLWDDVTFILNDYRVHVSWSHPRWYYLETIRSMAFDNLNILDMFNEDGFESASPQFVKVGKSRKKIVSYTMGNLLKPGVYALLEIEERKLFKTNDVKIYPSMTVSWLKDCRYVDICVPIEIKSTQDLITLANLVKHLLNWSTSLGKEFSEYDYSEKNWKEEQQLEWK